MIFEEKYFSCYTLLTNQISLSGCFYFVKYWTICVLCLGILGFKFEKVLPYLKSAYFLKFVNMQSFVQNQKPLFLVPKIPDLGVSRLQF